jgi:hypothetical protein
MSKVRAQGGGERRGRACAPRGRSRPEGRKRKGCGRGGRPGSGAVGGQGLGVPARRKVARRRAAPSRAAPRRVSARRHTHGLGEGRGRGLRAPLASPGVLAGGPRRRSASWQWGGEGNRGRGVGGRSVTPEREGAAFLRPRKRPRSSRVGFGVELLASSIRTKRSLRGLLLCSENLSVAVRLVEIPVLSCRNRGLLLDFLG